MRELVVDYSDGHEEVRLLTAEQAARTELGPYGPMRAGIVYRGNYATLKDFEYATELKLFQELGGDDPRGD